MVNINAAPMSGLSAGHSGGNPRLEPPLSTVWTASIGGAGTKLTEMAQPVVGDGRVYTVAPNGIVSAFDVRDGSRIWSVEIEPMQDDPLPGIGGGLALSAEVWWLMPEGAGWRCSPVERRDRLVWRWTFRSGAGRPSSGQTGWR